MAAAGEKDIERWANSGAKPIPIQVYWENSSHRERKCIFVLAASPDLGILD